jgi:hypothetical protein
VSGWLDDGLMEHRGMFEVEANEMFAVLFRSRTFCHKNARWVRRLTSEIFVVRENAIQRL